jgi:Na+/H+ antiporter NhaD/arsenite permease-like protein
MGRELLFLLLLLLSAAVLAGGRVVGIDLNRPQIESLTVFLGLIFGFLLYEDHRLAVSLGGVAVLLFLGLLSVDQFVAFAGTDVLVFLLGTFLVAGYLEDSRFFEYLAISIVLLVGRRPNLLLVVLMLAAMITSAVVGEVAAILFVGGAMLYLARRCNIKASPFLMMLVFATNTGSAATAFGPVGVTIALKAHLSVLEFFRWAMPISIVVLGLVFVLCRWLLAKDWRIFVEAVHREHATMVLPDPAAARVVFWRGGILVASMAILLIFHAQVESWLKLAPNVVLLGAALGAGAAALCLSGKRAGELIEHHVDWATLAFFMMLFISVGAMEASGVTGVLANGLARATGGKPQGLVLSIGWATGMLSALLANMLAVAAFLPIVAQLNAHGAACPRTVYWLMLFGATFMGNMTSIGSTCNIIACGMSEKRGHGRIGFAYWLKIGLVVSLSSMILATLLLAVQTDWLRK